MVTPTTGATHLFRLLVPTEKYGRLEARSIDPSTGLKTPSADLSAELGRVSPVLAVFFGVLLLVPAVIYFVTIVENAYNFPYEDDFNSALSFVSDYAFGNLTFGGKLKLLFSQYNEHRIVFDRLVFLADYALFGELNFSHLILVGNLSLVLICLLFFKASFRGFPLHQKLLFLLPVAYSLFLFQYWELSTWSMAALQNLYVIPFAMLSLYSLSRPGRGAFALACGAAILATFTSGNGMFTFVTGAALLLLIQSYRQLVLWLVVSALTIAFYFLGYIRPPYHPDVVDSLFNHSGRAIAYFFTLTGMILGPGRPTASMLFGIASLLFSLGLLGYAWYTKRISSNLPVIGWLLFLYLTCLSLMATRSGMGLGHATTPRYGIVVVMLFATQSVLALQLIEHRLLRLSVLAGYTVLAVFVYISPINQGNRQRIYDRTRTMRYSSAFYNNNPANLSFHWSNQEFPKKIYATAHKQGIYQIPPVTFNDLKSAPQPFDPTQLKQTNSVTYKAKPVEAGNFLIFYRSWALVNGTFPRKASIQLVARSSSACYAFATQVHTWNDQEDRLLSRHYTQPGFSCVLDKKELKPGHYNLWLRINDGQTQTDQPLDSTLDV
ncbi:hypothetical protein M0L20_07180 [Spirosoma sp. RP8]|uniref:YfhO family protein n=1 Tax=Spirosoma liriopis TaxID=2937440 RepID=A0ABT0HHK0_9BACT|nr:hypothetical protein [Spirosoma liriopis]MCK8491631.1 hypothetical protein [Spirosoma liriopis]